MGGGPIIINLIFVPEGGMPPKKQIEFNISLEKSEGDYVEKNSKFFETLKKEGKVEYECRSLGKDTYYDLLWVSGNEIPVPVFLEMIGEDKEMGRSKIISYLESKGINVGGKESLIPDDDFDDPTKMREWVKKDPYALRVAPEELKDDPQIVLDAMRIANEKAGIGLFDVASDRLKDDKKVAMEAIKIDWGSFNDLSDRLKDDKEVALLAIREDGRNFSDVSEKLKGDKEIVMEALRGYHIFYWHNGSKEKSEIPEELRKDPDVIELALKNRYYWDHNEKVIKSIPKEALNDERVRRIIEEAKKNKITEKPENK